MAGTKKIIDVSHPGQTAPSGNSKSVIITRRPVMSDPMMKEEKPSEAPEKIQVNTPRPKLQPLTAPPLKTAKTPAPKPDEAASEPEPKQEEPAPTAPAEHKELNIAPLSPPVEAVKDSEQAPEPSEPKPAQTQTSRTTTIPDSEVTDEDSTFEDQGDKGTLVGGAVEDEDELKAKADAELQKLVDSKKYFLPINGKEKQRTKRTIAIGVLLSLVLAAAWFDIALDAGLLHLNNIQPLTHFFSS